VETVNEEMRYAMIGALRDESPTPNEAKLLLAATRMLNRLDVAGWEMVRKPESRRAEEARQYRPQTLPSSLDWAATVGAIMGMLRNIIDWQEAFGKIAEDQFGIVIETMPEPS
jgi:hypothetical protein